MPRVDGLGVLAAMQADGLSAAVLVLTSSADDQHLVQALRAGALSYLPKTAGVDQVIEAVRAAARGESVLQPAATARMLRELRHAAADPLAQLTPRETDVLKGLAQGRSNREIARALSVSDETVKSHVSSILAKLGLADRTQAAIFALQRHLVPLDQALGPLTGKPCSLGKFRTCVRCFFYLMNGIYLLIRDPGGPSPGCRRTRLGHRAGGPGGRG